MSGRILITGAGGQLGRDLSSTFRSDEVYPLDRRALDITDRAAVASAVLRLKPAVIINAAAFNDVDRAESQEGQAMAVNAGGPQHLAEAAAKVKAYLVHISTDYVFDGRKASPYTEDDEPNPLSVYARSKREGERRVLASGASPCVLRTAWLYGQHGRNFVTTILAAARSGGPLRVVADQVGSPTATADLAGAIAELVSVRPQGLFHVVNAGACSRYEFARAIVRGQVEVLPITTAEASRPAARPAYSALISVRWEAKGLTRLRTWQAALTEFLASRSAA